MERSQFTDISSFTVQGRLLRLYGKQKKKPKALRVETKQGKYYIHLSKKLRKQGCSGLKKGEWVWITGSLEPKGGRCILKATELRVIAPEIAPSHSTNGAPENSSSPSTQSGKVLICLKSSCVKRGAKGVEKAVETVICDRNLTEDITIKPTGCMGHCKKGPNVVVMPGKQRYQKVKPSDAPRLISQA
ncbi:Ferredoxin, 2Fe-2s [Acaryochloris thomasi RCC1774]|uniref:Ferredoxin, 2Fe-2s n=1 Tax=Acaryochloris thomasi RCC1774 TaxID=1764569 RepID=A0A2W1J8X7_9CYAN|nr:(2Fe-2S) ferredoxin domain-containing protein [Acaryochloris thomasi]PZD70740.1 Ferredoxin, 2Fe-2s [Acaryochloris thomasi RCC1774]